MHYTLKQLRYFDAAARTGSIANAASEMNISQSSITAAIDILEESLGFDLFRRMPAKGISPTLAGEEVARLVVQFLNQVRIFESDLMSLSGDPTGTLRIGCYVPTAPFILPRLLKEIRASHPSIRIALKEGDMDSIVALLNSGALDVALTYQISMPKTMPFIPLFSARPYILLPDTSPLAKNDQIEMAELGNMPMIMLDMPSARQYFSSLYQDCGMKPTLVHSTKSSDVIRALVAGNFGYSILNICGPNDRASRNGYVCVPIAGDIQEPLYGLAYTKSIRRPAIVQAVLDICETLAATGIFDDLLLRPPEH
jgi:DNA-binding transcriptional LysR family regulator